MGSKFLTLLPAALKPLALSQVHPAAGTALELHAHPEATEAWCGAHTTVQPGELAGLRGPASVLSHCTLTLQDQTKSGEDCGASCPGWLVWLPEFDVHIHATFPGHNLESEHLLSSN